MRPIMRSLADARTDINLRLESIAQLEATVGVKAAVYEVDSDAELYQVETLDDASYVKTYDGKCYAARQVNTATVIERSYCPLRPEQVLTRLLNRHPELMTDAIDIVRGRL